MVEGGGKGTVFPVIFYDGEREVNMGNIKIQPTLMFKPFQLMISEKIGVSPNQISIYLCDRKSGGLKFEDRRRIPVTGKANFAVISREKSCFFLVVLKRSRKGRNRKVKHNNGVEFGEFFSENLVLLRRNYDRITETELASMNERVQNLQLQRENFDLVMQKPNPNPIKNLQLQRENFDLVMQKPKPNPVHLDSPSSFPRIQDTFPAKKKSVCYECASSDGCEAAAFHHCNNDAVVVGSFRSRSGPVNRPAKQ